jgi:hypothetical protein
MAATFGGGGRDSDSVPPKRLGREPALESQADIRRPRHALTKEVTAA